MKHPLYLAKPSESEKIKMSALSNNQKEKEWKKKRRNTQISQKGLHT